MNYSTDAGLPDNQIFALCAARNGGIWMTNGHGFSFFDGQNFTNYAIDETNWFSNIYEDSCGLLWITTGYRGEGLYSFDGKQLRHYTHEDGLRQGRYIIVYEDHRGRLWCAGYSGLFCFDGHRFTN